MSSALTAKPAAKGDQTAQRLLKASSKNSYDPLVDIDWDAPPVDGLYWIPPNRSSLFGTTLWDEMSQQQRIELSKHEMASIASIGMWFELIVMQMLLRENYNCDPQSEHMQFVLSEVGDETRHSTMFGKLLDNVGAPSYRPGPFVSELGRIFKSVSGGPSSYAAILVAEEILDRLQREAIPDDRVQPLARQVAKIHVTEEARHVSFARNEVMKAMQHINPAEKAVQQAVCALVSYEVVTQLIRPDVYESVGLDPVKARKAALANPFWQETMRFAGERIMPFLYEADMIGGPGMALWHKSFLIERPKATFPATLVPTRVSRPAGVTAAWGAGVAGLVGTAATMIARSVGHVATNGRIAAPS